MWALLLLLIPSLSFAATGDVLFNCDFTETGATPQEVVLACGAENDFTPEGMTHATVQTGGHDGGKYLNYYFPDTGELNEGFNFLVNAPEVTLVYWEKFDVDASVSDGWNVKSVRAYSGAAGCDFIGAVMSRWNAGHWNQGVFATADATIEAGYTNYNPDTSSAYCVTSGSEYACGDGAYGAIAVESLISGTTWHKVRLHLKMPSPVGASNGESTLWIDGNLVYHLYNLSGPPPAYCGTPWGDNITKIVVQPSDAFMDLHATSTYNHGYDDITLYEGLVGPDASGKLKRGLGHAKHGNGRITIQ